MKKLIAMTMAIAMVLAQSGMAGAFVSDVTSSAITASATPSGTPTATMTVALKNISDNAAATTLGWTGVNAGSTGWKHSGQYASVDYVANQIGWGVQIYTDNTDASANPKYAGDPNTDPAQQPAGLIGAQNKLLTCPMALLVSDTVLTDTQLDEPVQNNPNDPGSFFVSGYDKVVGGDKEIVWFFLKDLEGTVWQDADSDGVIDAGEIKKTFNYPTGYGSGASDDYATIVNTNGASSGWVNVQGTAMQRVAGPTTPIQVYFAANFSKATELQEYKTSTLTLELYHQ